MGILFGRNTGSRSYTYSEKLAGKLAKKGAAGAGAEALLGLMREGRDPRELSPAEAAQAATSLARAARRLRGDDRRVAEQIAADAQAAAESGRPWRVG